MTRFRARTPEESYAHRTERSGACLLWTGANDGTYGHIWNGTAMEQVHRWAYRTFVGPIPEGLKIDHQCNMTLCVEPSHLRPLTNGENIRRPTDLACRSGHPREEFTYIDSRGRRVCRSCRRIRERRAA